MALHSGIWLDFLEFGGRGRLFSFPPLGESTAAIPLPVDFDSMGELEDGTRAETDEALAGLILPGTADLVIFGEIYLAPLEFDLGLIADTTEHEIFVWNSDYENIAIVSAITQVNADGTQFEHPVLPFYIMRGAGHVFEFSVLQEGPAGQDTQFVITINSMLYSVRVTGLRIEIFPYEPDWADAIELEYQLQTIVSKTENFVEQRRLMYEDPERTLSAKFGFIEGEDSRNFLHELRVLAKKAVGVPVWSEPMLPDADIPAGASSVNLQESIEYYWNLQNLDTIVLIMSISDSHVFELKEVASLGVSSIEFKTPVSGDFEAEDTVLYPVFAGVISNKKQQFLTDQIISGNLDFKEVYLGG